MSTCFFVFVEWTCSKTQTIGAVTFKISLAYLSCITLYLDLCEAVLKKKKKSVMDGKRMYIYNMQIKYIFFFNF